MVDSRYDLNDRGDMRFKTVRRQQEYVKEIRDAIPF